MKAIVSSDHPLISGGNARTDFLKPGQFLLPGDELVSSNGLFRLVFSKTHGDLKLVDYNGTTYWSSGGASYSPAFCRFQTDLNFVCVDSNDKTYWTSGPTNYSEGLVKLQNNGNLVIYGDSGNVVIYGNSGIRAVWQTGTVRTVPTMTRQVLYSGDFMDPGDLLLSANKEFALVNQQNFNIVLSNKDETNLWSTNTFTKGRLIMQQDGNLVLYQLLPNYNGNGYGALGPVLWSMSSVNANRYIAGSYVKLLDDGNFVVYSPSNQVIWATWTNTPVASSAGPISVATTPQCGAVLDGGWSASSQCGAVFAGISGCGGVLSGIGMCGVVYSGGSLCAAVANAIGACGADVATFGVCGVVAAASGAAVVTVAGVGACGVVAAIAGVCGAVVAAAGASAIGSSGASACGAVACGAAACGADASGAGACLEASGAGACGANATGAQGTGVCGAQVGFCGAVLCVAIPIGGNW